MNGNFLLRIRYAKRGRLSFLSHKETVHAMERIVARAHLPYALTQGFSPHMRSSFGLALPVGCAGCAELFDVLLTSYIPADEALERLQKAAVPDLMPLECFYEDPHVSSIVADFTLSDWQADIVGTTQAALEDALDKLLECGCIEIVKVKKTRRGQVEKVKRTEFEGRLLSAKIAVLPMQTQTEASVSAQANAFAVAQATVQMQANATMQALEQKSAETQGEPEIVSCLWTSQDKGNGALRPDLFVKELIKGIPNAQLLALKRLDLRKQDSKQDSKEENEQDNKQKS